MKINSGTSKAKKVVVWGLISLIILPSSAFFSKNLISSFKTKTTTSFKIKNIEIYFDEIYSEKLKNNLQNYIFANVTKCNNFWNLNQQQLYKELCNKFNIIKKFDLRIDDKSNLIVQIEGYTPICFINKNEILSDANVLLPCEYFKYLESEKLPNINIENLGQFCSNGLLDTQVCEFIHKITDQHWQIFDINYVKSSEIRLYPKNTSFSCILLSNKKTFFDFNKINKAFQLYQKIASDEKIQKKLNYTNKKLLILDLRFKSSIVARAKDGLKEGGE